MTINAFRKYARLEETMIRASMPRTSAADPTPLPAFAQDETPAGARWSSGRRFPAPLTYTLGEVAHA